MKTIKFLAALAIPAMFAACTSEEVAFDTPLQNGEVVGAKLVGTGISISLEGTEADSRYANGVFESTDVLGLGWLTNGTPSELQDESSTLKDVLYANNMFELVNGSFTTKGNVYEGWHFAYFPFERMDYLAAKEVNINPAQDCLWENRGGDRYHERFAVSARQFLTAKDLDENNQLKDKKFTVEWATNEIVMDLQPSTEFVNSSYLNDLAIQKVEFNAGADVMAGYANLVASKIPAAVYDKDGEYDAAETKKAVKDALPSILTPFHYVKNTKTTGYTNIVTTDIEVDMVTGTGGTVRVFTLPYATTKNKVTSVTPVDVNPTIKIYVEGGYFTIKTEKNAEEGSFKAENNAALAELIEAYDEEGKLAQVQGGIKVAFNLYPEIFTPDFKNIDDYDEWKKCVNIVKALGYTKEQTFNITGDIVVNQTAISMPTKCGIKVTGKKAIKIAKTLKMWPENLNTAAVDVVFDENNTISGNILAKSITNNADMTIKEGSAYNNFNTLEGTITNNGTIIVNKYAKVTEVVNKGRIGIIYGGIAEVATGEEGVIYYTILGGESAKQINNLVTEGGVNTFVVNAGKKFNFNTTMSSSTNDEYEGTVAGASTEIDPDNLSGITVEMNGGEVIGNLTKYSVKTVKVLSGNTNVTTDVITSKIDVVAGELVMDASMASLTVKNKLNLSTTDVNVAKDATLIANAETHVNTLVNAGTVKANAGYLFHYNAGTNSGTLTGDVEECDCPKAPTQAEIELAEDQLNMQTLVNEMNPMPTSYDKLAEQLTNYAQANNVTENPTYKAVQFAVLMKKYFNNNGLEFEYSNDYYTVANIKMFEILIGKKIEF